MKLFEVLAFAVFNIHGIESTVKLPITSEITQFSLSSSKGNLYFWQWQFLRSPSLCRGSNSHWYFPQAIEFEEQNAILQKHVENMKSAISKLEHETGQQQDNNEALEKHLVII